MTDVVAAIDEMLVDFAPRDIVRLFGEHLQEEIAYCRRGFIRQAGPVCEQVIDIPLSIGEHFSAVVSVDDLRTAAAHEVEQTTRICRDVGSPPGRRDRRLLPG